LPLTHLNNLAQLLQATNRLGEVQPAGGSPTADEAQTSLSFWCSPVQTDHLHPDLRAAFANYFSLLKKISLREEQIAEHLSQAGTEADGLEEALWLKPCWIATYCSRT
jgi:hypothetical protein